VFESGDAILHFLSVSKAILPHAHKAVNPQNRGGCV